MSSTALNNDWFVPIPPVHFGAGRVSELSGLIKERGACKPLFVTDSGLASLPIVTNVLAELAASKLTPVLFADVRSNPTLSNVHDGVQMYREQGCDMIIAFGGGSGIDVAKAISLIANNEHSLWDFCYFENPENTPEPQTGNFFVPYIAIPTTAGTGSEVSGSSCVIIDPETGTKRVPIALDHQASAVICDPELLLSLPAHISAWTGVDALTHAIEAYCVDSFNPMCDGIALEAIRLCHTWLARSVAQGDDLLARSQMMAASSSAAVAFNKGMGSVHALAHSLGGLHDTPHGLANAVLLPYVLLHNRPAIESKMIQIARTLGLSEDNFDAVLQWIIDLRAELGIPHSLAELELAADTAAVSEVARYAMNDFETENNPVAMSLEAYESIYRNALAGELAGHTSRQASLSV